MNQVKIRDIILRVDMSQANEACLRITEPLAAVSGVEFQYSYDWNNSGQDRVKGYFLQREIDSDSHVGTAVYFLDGEPVFVAVQEYRKANAKLYFLDEDSANKVCEFLLTFQEIFRDEPIFLTDDMVIPELRSYESVRSVFSGKAFHKGSPVLVRQIPWGTPHYGKNMLFVEGQGEEYLVDVQDIEYPLNLIDERT